MNEKNLVICDKEFQYANSLAENIAKQSELSVKVHICSNLERVLQLMEERTIHILVVDEKYTYEERREITADQTFVLSKGEVADLGEDEWAVRKYQCCDGIIREIFEVYVEKTKENLVCPMRKKRAKLIAVYSPIHRIGKTTFALALGKEHARHRRTLYLNMEEHPGFDGASEEGMNMGDLLYYLKQGNQNAGIRMQSMVRQMEEMDYLLPIPVSQDLKEVTLDEWELFLEKIVQGSAYESIILDIGESVQGLFQILEKCDRIYMPVLRDPISVRKMQRFEKDVERLQKGKLLQKTYRFVMPDNVEEYAKIRVKEEC